MADLDIMIAKALAAQVNAHAPYSGHPIGAAIQTVSGKIFAGCNVENAAHPSGQCAEATAIGNMVTAGASRIKDVVVVGPGDVLCPPCGECRQRIREFGDENTMIHMVVGDQAVKTMSLDELLPLSFGPDTLSE